MTGPRRGDLLASWGVALAGAAWGLFWLPMRALDTAGLEAAWATVSLFAAAILVFFPIGILRRRQLVAGGLAVLITGMFTGAAFGLYATALVLTDVVRALLLFYLTPVWSTLLGCFLLGESITKYRAVALVMGVTGLVVILGYEHGFPLPRNVGDWLALVSGMAWAYGSVRISGAHHIGFVESTFAYFIGGLVIAVVMAFLPIESIGSVPSAAAIKTAAPWVFVIAALLMAPSMLIVFWATTRLSPGRVGLLLMTEALVGVVSAALLTDEPFGARELAGTVLIIGAAVTEMLQQDPLHLATVRGESGQ